MSKYFFAYILLIITGCFLSLQVIRPGACRELEESIAAPEFSHTGVRDWINSRPLKLLDLRGKVVMVDFWTFDCWNCYRSFPWLTAMEERLKPNGLMIIGIHSPEFEHEKARKNIEAKVTEFNLTHPVMIDNDHSYWQAMGNRYWPSYYLIDKKGYIRAVFFGETHAGDRQALQIESMLKKLLTEPD